jgi:hypothetical protein
MVNMLQISRVFVGCGFQIALPLRNYVPVIPNNRSQTLSCSYAIETTPHAAHAFLQVAARMKEIFTLVI